VAAFPCRTGPCPTLPANSISGKVAGKVAMRKKTRAKRGALIIYVGRILGDRILLGSWLRGSPRRCRTDRHERQDRLLTRSTQPRSRRPVARRAGRGKIPSFDAPEFDERRWHHGQGPGRCGRCPPGPSHRVVMRCAWQAERTQTLPAANRGEVVQAPSPGFVSDLFAGRPTTARIPRPPSPSIGIHEWCRRIGV